MSWELIVFILIIAALVITVAVAVTVIKKKVGETSQMLFGTSSFKRGIEEQQKNISETPRSLQAMTSVFLPAIGRDFPEFNYSEYAAKAAKIVEDYLIAVSSSNKNLISDEYYLVKNQAQTSINDLKQQNITQHYAQIVVHKTEIANYIKEKGKCSIIFVSSVGLIDYVTYASGKLILGDKEIKKQTVFEVELAYIQDVNVIKDHKFNKSIGINCPNCGAPITNIGSKFCEYCGTGVKEINIYCWEFCNIKEQTKARKIT